MTCCKSPADERRPPWRVAVLALLLLVLVFGCFYRVYHNAFINFDDPDYVTLNTHIQAGLSAETIRWSFTTFRAGNWHPLTWLSHALDCQLFGMNAGAHHLVSAAIHAINTALVFLVILRATRHSEIQNSKLQTPEKPQTSSSKRQSEKTLKPQTSTLNNFWPSVLIAALFGLHPMHVESVAWASERKDVLSTLFFLLTLLAYVRYVGKLGADNELNELNRINALNKTETRHDVAPSRTTLFYVLALSLFACALMSKPMVVTLPFVLLLLDYWPLQRFEVSAFSMRFSKILLEKLPFLALSAAACAITVIAQKESQFVASTSQIPFDIRLANSVVSYCAYVKKMFWPTDLIVYYPYRRGLSLELGLAGGVFLLFVSVCAWLTRRKRPYVLVGWLWYLGMLVPVIGLLQVGLQSMADRYSYLPSIGVFIIVVFGVADLFRYSENTRRFITRTFRLCLCAASVVVLSVCAAATEKQLAYWKSNEPLYRHALAVAPDNPVIIANLGSALVEAGRYKEATEYLASALNLSPGFAQVEISWGVAYLMQKEILEAIPHFQRAIDFDPKSERAHYLLGNAFASQGQRDHAASQYEITLRINPDSAFAANDLAWILATSPNSAQRNGSRAVELAEKACRLTKYSDPQLIGTLAAAYAEAGRFSEAIKTAERAAALAEKTGDKYLANKNRELREAYLRNTPYHEPDSSRLDNR